MSAPAAGFPVEHEEHENHERYLITYADMITLLMALFIILFAIGQTDLAKYRRFAEGASGHAAGAGVLEGGAAPDGDLVGADLEAPVDAAIDLGAGLRRAIGPLGVRSDAVRVEERGVVVDLDADGFSFAPGASELTDAGRAVVAAVAGALSATEGQIIVEGHTDDVAPAWPETNWDLSVRRAVAVVEALGGAGVPMDRLTATGHAATRPVASNETPEGRAANRRVEIVIQQPPDELAAQDGEVDPPVPPIHR